MIFLTVVVLLGGFCGVESKDVRLLGVEGGEAKITCSYSNAVNSVKYFCKEPCRDEDVLIGLLINNKLEGVGAASNGRYRIQGAGNTFFVTITDLTLADSGGYRCGISRSGPDKFINVQLSVLSPGGPPRVPRPTPPRVPRPTPPPPRPTPSPPRPTTTTTTTTTPTPTATAAAAITKATTTAGTPGADENDSTDVHLVILRVGIGVKVLAVLLLPLVMLWAWKQDFGMDEMEDGPDYVNVSGSVGRGRGFMSSAHQDSRVVEEESNV